MKTFSLEIIVPYRVETPQTVKETVMKVNIEFNVDEKDFEESYCDSEATKLSKFLDMVELTTGGEVYTTSGLPIGKWSIGCSQIR